jgi:DNA-binding transcriptional ArsR family regulator
MADISQYNDSVRSNNTSFKDSQEAALRRVIRAVIRRGPFTKSEKAVVLAFINHWFHHKSSAKGVVHPGRKKLAKRADVSIRTVSSTLNMLRDHGAIIAVDRLRGLDGKATEYKVDTVALTALCEKKKSDLRYYGAQNCTGGGRAKIAHRSYDVNVIPFPRNITSKGAA